MHGGKSQFGTFSLAAEAAAAAHARWAASLPTAPPSIADILSPDVLGDDDALAETLAADAEERLRRALPARLETYLSVVPDIAGRPGACRAVLMVEVVARTDETEEAIRTDLTGRFPSLAAEVDTVLGLASLFRSAVADAAQGSGEHVRAEVLGKYRLHRRLGEGAFGEVWQAWDSKLERYVALKILRATHHTGIRGQQRFLAEIRAAAALDHESVVRIHDAGRFEETGEYFIDAQLVGEPAPTADDPRAIQPGESLEQRLKGGPVPAREAATLIAAAARGVAAAHARGITHRDIKPSNILVTRAGRPLVSDFGLSLSGVNASARRDAEKPPRSVGAGEGTDRGARGLAGTPAYMAPEQAGALSATPLSDVFSLGATLRALLLGKPPYEPDPSRTGSARDQVLDLARAASLTPVRQARPDLPRTLGAICDKATAAAPESRYSTAQQFAADLEAFLSGRPTLADPPGAARTAALWCRRHRLAAAVIAGSALILVGTTVTFIQRLTRERDRALSAEIDASAQRDSAIAARDAVDTINQFLTRTFSSARQLEQTGDFSVIDAVELASRRAGRSFADRPLIEAGVRHFLGQAAMSTGHLDTARRELDIALGLRRAHLGEHAAATLATRRQIADLLAREGKLREAEAVYREILDPLRLAAGEDSYDALRALTFLGNQMRTRGELGTARRDLERAASGYRRIKLYGTADRQHALDMLVLLYAELHEFDLAEGAQREIIAMNEAELGRDDLSTLNATQALGWTLRAAGKVDESEALYRDVLARYAATIGPDHPAALHVKLELATAIGDRNPDGAALLAREVIAGSERDPSSQNALRARVILGKTLIAARRDAEAEPALRDALDASLKYRGADHLYSRESAAQLIRLLERHNRRAEADAVRARVPLYDSPKR